MPFGEEDFREEDFRTEARELGPTALLDPCVLNNWGEVREPGSASKWW